MQSTALGLDLLWLASSKPLEFHPHFASTGGNKNPPKLEGTVTRKKELHGLNTAHGSKSQEKWG